jgi:hypothetical protein
MKHLLMAVYQVCSNKSPWFKIGIGPGAYIQVSNFRAIMALLFIVQGILKLLGTNVHNNGTICYMQQPDSYLQYQGHT